MLRNLIWVPVVAIALLPAVASAQFQQGDWSMTLSAAGTSDRDLDSTSVAGSGTIGYFMTDQIEVNLRQNVAYVNIEDGGDSFAGSTAIGGDFHFDLDRWQPFLGAAVGYRYGDGIDDDWFALAEGGLKYFVNNTTFVFGSVGYQFGFSGSSDEDIWVYALGIGFRW
jgi:hypothetical protein